MVLPLLLAAAHLTPDYPVQPVPFTQVKLTDGFWAPRIETNRKVTIPFAFQKCEETGRVALFDRAAKAQRGEEVDRKPPGYPFDDTDLYKVIEGASYSLSASPDAQLEGYVDALIAKIAAAQEPDGYLYTTRTINPQAPHPWAGKDRWELEQHDSHELYNLGHLFEAAVAHYQATGKRSLLDVALKGADLLVQTFGPDKRKIWPGHQVTEMGLVKLSRVTGEKKYLDLAKFLLDCRGGSGEYWQAHKPVLEQESAVGHAVRASYMYSGMADVAALTGDSAYLQAIDRIWDDVVGSKLYITGGIGASGAGEAFGKPYQLPNMSAYAETCAAIGNAYWNHRLFLLHKDAKYIDVLERTLYNGLISGVALDGKTFFYPNPLESAGQHARSPWFGVACCPGNMTRFLASVPGYFYAQDGKDLYVNLYASGQANLKVGGTAVAISQRANYPWSGDIQLRVDPSRATDMNLKVRIPGWAREKPVPSTLYRFADAPAPTPTLTVNGHRVRLDVVDGYAAIERRWQKGDIVQLSLPMPARRIEAHARVNDDRGRVAVQRGPIVYCAEWPDNGSIRNLLLPRDSKLTGSFKRDLLGGVTIIDAAAQALSKTASGETQRTSKSLTLIPYFAWANRGRGEMMVWLPGSEDVARPTPVPTLASRGTLKTSEGGKTPNAINDQILPAFMGDDSAPFFHWWPKKGTTEWVELTLPNEATVSETSVFWFDDTGRGECRIPKSWRVLYRSGNDWVPVEETNPYGVEKDRANVVRFKPVQTKQLRLEVALQPTWSTGILEWEVK